MFCGIPTFISWKGSGNLGVANTKVLVTVLGSLNIIILNLSFYGMKKMITYENCFNNNFSHQDLTPL